MPADKTKAAAPSAETDRASRDTMQPEPGQAPPPDGAPIVEGEAAPKPTRGQSFDPTLDPAPAGEDVTVPIDKG